MPADYDCDGKTDLAVDRAGTWYINRSRLGFFGVPFGDSNDKLVPADCDGDGKGDISVWRGGTWYLNRSAQGLIGITYGASTDKPVPNVFIQ